MRSINDGLILTFEFSAGEQLIECTLAEIVIDEARRRSRLASRELVGTKLRAQTHRLARHFIARKQIVEPLELLDELVLESELFALSLIKLCAHERHSQIARRARRELGTCRPIARIEPAPNVGPS